MKKEIHWLFTVFKKGVFKLVKGIVYLVGIYLLSWVLKICIGFYHVPSPSMVPTLETGDWIFVVKLPYVWRSPEYYPLTKKGFPYWHSGILLNPEQDDILVFTNPISHQLHPSDRMSFVKRCVGLPGDTLYVLPSGEVISRSGIYVPNVLFEGGYKKEKQLLLISQHDSTQLSYTTVSKWKNKKTTISYKSAGNRERFITFTPNEIQEVVVPKQGMHVGLQETNKKEWKELIRRDLSNFEPQSQSDLAVDSVLTSGEFIFAQDFYFFIGDNMSLASDSRKWQSVPEKLIIGKVWFRFRWNPLKLNRFAWLG